MSAAPVPNYAHKATFLEPHDGDSFWLRVDFGMNTHGVKLELPLYCRLVGIDTWELDQPLGIKARDFTTTWLRDSKSIICQTIKDDGHMVGEEKYGRWFCRVWVEGVELSSLLRNAGMEKR